MGFISWRRKKKEGGNGDGNKEQQLTIPGHFVCPISLDLMKDPVTLSSGITYDREGIETWLEAGNFCCPVTKQVLWNFDLIPNHTLREMIQEWSVQNRKFGIERIPTPRVPVSSLEVSEVLFSISAATKRLDQCDCLDSVYHIKKWCNESDRNTRCIQGNNTSSTLAAAFDAFATDSFEKNAALLEEILSVITRIMSPQDTEAHTHLGSQHSLRCILWFLQSRNPEANEKAITVLKELLSSSPNAVEALTTIEGVSEVLLRFIKDPVRPGITKASLLVIFYLLSSPSNEKTKHEFVNLGMLNFLLELIINESDKERSISERALGVLDALCDCEQGREVGYENALTGPILVKKILRVSPLASEHAVSALWKLVKYEYDERKNNGSVDQDQAKPVLVEALQVGAFQKLVLLLQLGCGDDTKEKATELLKMMNPYRAAGLECIDSVDFKNLKRSF